jgi:hypothetical protein
MWSNADEFAFINGLGYHRDKYEEPTDMRTRATLISKYIKAIKRRNIWGNLDKKKITAHAYDTLARIESFLEKGGKYEQR